MDSIGNTFNMPTLNGFILFIQNIMGIATGYLPSNSASIQTAYNTALDIVNPDIASISTTAYANAVYNLAGDLLINYAQDVVTANAGIVWATGIATVTTAAAHGFYTGDTIMVSGAIAPGFDGKFQISVTGASTFTYPIAANPGTCTVPGFSAETFFSNLRATWKIAQFVPGVIASSSDVSTSESLLNLEAMKNFTMGDLQRLKTPYGRTYLQIAQDYGQLFGMT